MTIDLTPEQQEIISDLVASGRFADSGEVLSQSLRLMRERETKLSQLRAEIQKGRDSGEPTPLDMPAIIAEARRRYHERRQ